jgi:hypothetical protein
MAYPVILVNNSTGSDTDASGAGPTTALSGSAAWQYTWSGSGSEYYAYFTDGSDLTDVAVDGSHVLFFDDTTAGRRAFARISSKVNTGLSTTGDMTALSGLIINTSANGYTSGGIVMIEGAGSGGTDLVSKVTGILDTTRVNVDPPAGTSVTTANIAVYRCVRLTEQLQTSTTTAMAWAIGGKRASIGSTSSKRLFDNNSNPGDAMPGWTVQMDSGHTETIASTYYIRRSGDTGGGRITLKGQSSSGTLPILTFSNDGTGMTTGTSISGIEISNIEFQNSAATKTVAIALVLGTDWKVEQVVIHDPTNYFGRGIQTGARATVKDCLIQNCAGWTGISAGLLMYGPYNIIIGNYMGGSTGVGILHNLDGCYGAIVMNNILSDNDVSNYRTNSASGAYTGVPWVTLIGNTLYGSSTGPGIEHRAVFTTPASWEGLRIINNIFSNNASYGIYFNGSPAPTLAALQFYNALVEYNDFYNNTSGTCNITGLSLNAQTLDPQFVDAANGNFAIGVNLKAFGYPSKIGGYNGPTSSYVDIGAAQREEKGSPSNILIGGIRL